MISGAAFGSAQPKADIRAPEVCRVPPPKSAAEEVYRTPVASAPNNSQDYLFG